MKNFITASVNSFSEFLTENQKKVNETASEGIINSFVIENKIFSLNNKINTLIRSHERSFYFEKPDENFKLLGFNEAVVISENGERRFAATAKKIKDYQNKILNNWHDLNLKNIPLFLGAMKFSVEHSDQDWKDFNDSTWFVPEFTFFENGGEKYIIYNTIFSRSSLTSIKNKFQNRLEYLFSITGSELSELPQVRKIEGSGPKEKKKWKNIVNTALEEIEEKKISKVVLSRKIELMLESEPSLDKIIFRLKENYSSCYLFIYHHGKSSFFGATPEKLAYFTNNRVQVEALAGSAPRGSDSDDLKFEEELKNKKNVNEHQIVSEHIKSSLSGLTKELKIKEELSVKKLKNIQHLFTSLSAELNDEVLPLNLLSELYPTPAICGNPRLLSLQLIKKSEGYKRGLYSGIIGWLGKDNEGEFVVAIRSALNINNKVAAFAGSGIVHGSDPDKEFEETELKLKPILSLFSHERSRVDTRK